MTLYQAESAQLTIAWQEPFRLMVYALLQEKAPPTEQWRVQVTRRGGQPMWWQIIAQVNCGGVWEWVYTHDLPPMAIESLKHSDLLTVGSEIAPVIRKAWHQDKDAMDEPCCCGGSCDC